VTGRLPDARRRYGEAISAARRGGGIRDDVTDDVTAHVGRPISVVVVVSGGGGGVTVVCPLGRLWRPVAARWRPRGVPG